MIETSVRFRACLPFILKEEGGYSNDKNDPGGMTDDGIIQREYDAYRKSKGLPTQWVKKITPDEYTEIYWTSYWLPDCSLLPIGLDLCYFNIAVNGGPTRATHLLQRALGIIDDGVWGTQTSTAVSSIKPEQIQPLIVRFTAFEEAFYRSLSTFKYFGKDWIRRAERCEALALTMHTSAPST